MTGAVATLNEIVVLIDQEPVASAPNIAVTFV